MSQPTLTPAAFAQKWRGVTTTEKAAAQEHFIDLCRMLGEPTPHEADPTGDHYAFERRVEKAGGGDGVTRIEPSHRLETRPAASLGVERTDVEVASTTRVWGR